MPGYGFSGYHIFPYKSRIYDLPGQILAYFKEPRSQRGLEKHGEFTKHCLP